MKEAIQAFDTIRDEGLIKDFAIGGGAATLFYTEPFFTEDVDIFVDLSITSPQGIINLRPIYNRLKSLGGVLEGPYIKIGDALVQIIPAPTSLEEEALKNADERMFQQKKVKVYKPEYLIAIYLTTKRSKDALKIQMLSEQARLDYGLLQEIIKRHGLEKQWERIQNLGP